jgi:hypothetical protein
MGYIMHTDTRPLPGSFEGLDDQSFLGKAYIALLGRPVDPQGFRGYIARLRAGVPRSTIWDELARCDEARRHAGLEIHTVKLARAEELLELDGEAFVEQAYRSLLGRAPDTSGMQHYFDRLASGVPKVQIVADIHTSEEGQACAARLSGLKEMVQRVQKHGADAYDSVSDLLELADDGFIRSTYRLFLGREPDDEGRRIYGDLLAQGMSRLYVVKEIATSPEAREKARKVRGLEKVLRRYGQANRRDWTGWYMRQVKGVESDLPAERQARAAAYGLRALLRQRS